MLIFFVILRNVTEFYCKYKVLKKNADIHDVRKLKRDTRMAISVYEQLNSMGLNIDRPTLQQVSETIMKRAQQKNSQYNTEIAQNYFQKRDIGLDMYNGKADLKLVNQVALNNSGLQVQLSQETLSKIYYLNTAAAKNVQNAVEGKMTIAVNEITLKEHSTPVNSNNRIVTNETAKDKNGSNPFYHGELLLSGQKGNKEEPVDEQKAITSSIFI